MEKIQPQDNLERHKASLLGQLVVVIICWNDISKWKPSRHRLKMKGHWPQPRLAVVEPSAQHYLLQIPALPEIQEENILAPFPLNVNLPNQWAWAFPGSLSKRRKMRLLLTWGCSPLLPVILRMLTAQLTALCPPCWLTESSFPPSNCGGNAPATGPAWLPVCAEKSSDPRARRELVMVVAKLRPVKGVASNTV